MHIFLVLKDRADKYYLRDLSNCAALASLGSQRGSQLLGSLSVQIRESASQMTPNLGLMVHSNGTVR